MHAGVLPIVGDPDNVMRRADAAVDAMAVLSVNTTVAVVVVALIREPRVMMGPISALVISGNVPLMEESRIAAPSLVVPAATAAIAGCATAGRVNCENFKVIASLEAKLPALFKANIIFKTCALNMEGLHVAAFAGMVTVHAGLLPIVGDPASVMMILED